METSVVVSEQQALDRSQGGYSNLIALAIEKDLDLARLEKLVELQKRVMEDQAKRAYVEALSRCKAELPAVVAKTKQVKAGSANYKHAELHNVCDVVVPHLAAHGLSHSWTCEQFSEPERRTITRKDGSSEVVTVDVQKVTVRCVIIHTGGHCESVQLSCAVDDTGNKNRIQQLGSAITYLERYTLKAMLGIAEGGQDDDGQAAGQRPEDRPAKTETEKAVKAVTKEQLEELERCALAIGGEPADFLRQEASKAGLTSERAAQLIGRAQKRVKEISVTV